MTSHGIMSSSSQLEACILAAGVGSRMGATADHPKPLVSILGRTMIDRLLDGLICAGIESITVVIRPEHLSLKTHIDRRSDPAVKIVKCDSMGGKESLMALHESVVGDTFLLVTVDSIYSPQELSNFIRSCCDSPRTSMILSVVPRDIYSVDDVGVELDDDSLITDIGKHLRDTSLISEGPMWCTRRVFDYKEVFADMRRMRLSEFQRHLLVSGEAIYGQPLTWAMDVDTVDDVRRAEPWLKQLDDAKCASRSNRGNR